MAHNTRIRPTGFWLYNSAVLQTEFESFDLAQFQALNADLGGTWAPATQIILGGHGLQITGPLAVPGAATFSGGVGFSTAAVTFGTTAPATVNGYLTLSSTSHLVVNGATAFNQILNALSGLAVTNGLAADTLTVIGASEMLGALDVQGAATLDSTLTVTGAATCNGALTVTGTTRLNGATVAQAVTCQALNASSLACTANLTVGGAAQFDGTAHVIGAAQFDSTLTVTGASTLNGNTTFGPGQTAAFAGTASFGGTTNLGGTVNVNTALNYRAVSGPNAAASYGAVSSSGVTGADYVITLPGTLSGNQTYTLSNVGATQGNVITFYNADPSHGVITISNGSSTLATLTGSGSALLATFVFVAGGWIILP